MEDLKKQILLLLARGKSLEAAFSIGSIRDCAFDMRPYVQCISALVAKLNSIAQRKTTHGKIAQINHFIFEKFGMAAGNGSPRLIIDDPERFYLDRVVDKRSGSPLSMAILYWHVAQSVGLSCECLALPSYLLLLVRDMGREIYIDPFEGGRVLAADEFHRKFKSAFARSRLLSTSVFERVTEAQLVIRLIIQLKQIYVLKSDSIFALRAVELLTALFPESPEFARDRGILYCELECFSKAREDLKFYLTKRKTTEDLGEIKRLSRMLKSYREVVN